MTQVIYGCEITLDSGAPTQHWFESLVQRERHLLAISSTLRKTFDTREVKAHRLANVDGVVYAEHGAPAVHEKWRLTLFRASHKTHCYYDQWVAFVDTIGGKVVICDSEKKFEPSQYVEWSKEPSVEESYRGLHDVELFWPRVRPALTGEDCHYRVVNPQDIVKLDTLSKPHLFHWHYTRAGMPRVEAEAASAS